MPESEAAKARYARYRKKHRDEINARNRARYAADPQKHIGYSLAWRAKNRERVNQIQRDYISRHPEKAKERTQNLRSLVINAYGGKCVCCGETETAFLQLDHVNDDGAAHRKEIGAGHRTYLWASKNNFPDTLQILCANCNMAKRSGCPHQEHLFQGHLPEG